MLRIDPVLLGCPLPQPSWFVCYPDPVDCLLYRLPALRIDPFVLSTLSPAIQAGKPCVVQLMNYKKNGDPFVNYLSVSPLFDAAGKVRHGSRPTD